MFSKHFKSGHQVHILKMYSLFQTTYKRRKKLLKCVRLICLEVQFGTNHWAHYSIPNHFIALKQPLTRFFLLAALKPFIPIK